jgi:redox-sensitive bicupin YhaK (pirin superfamily)
MSGPEIDVRRSGVRSSTTTGWLESRHSFSFGTHYDPANVGHALLVAHNEDLVQAGSGYDTHPHRDIEIVTWVLDGSLVHQDSDGNTGIIAPGLAQRMSAGTGVRHSERNDSWRLGGGPRHETPVHFVQMWVLPDEPGGEPGYAQRDVSADLASGDLVPVASGRPGVDAAVRINSTQATLHAARIPAGGRVRLPDAPYLHLFVARGAVELEGAGTLTAGDAVRFTGDGGPDLTAVALVTEVLVWEMHASRPAVG